LVLAFLIDKYEIYAPSNIVVLAIVFFVVHAGIVPITRLKPSDVLNT